MRVICDKCGHVYDAPRMVAGQEDAACSEDQRGTLRELTRPEEIWITRHAELHATFIDQAQTIRELKNRQQVLL